MTVGCRHHLFCVFCSVYPESTAVYDQPEETADRVLKTSQRARPRLCRLPSVDLQSSSADSAASRCVSVECVCDHSSRRQVTLLFLSTIKHTHTHTHAAVDGYCSPALTDGRCFQKLLLTHSRSAVNTWESEFSHDTVQITYVYMDHSFITPLQPKI